MVGLTTEVEGGSVKPEAGDNRQGAATNGKYAAAGA